MPKIRRPKLMIQLLVYSLCLIVMTACRNPAPETNEKEATLSVVTTFFPMEQFTQALVHDLDHITVDTLITGSVEPHDYEPSAKDIAKIQDADVFIYNDPHMESWVTRVLKQMDTDKTVVIQASQGIPLLENKDSEHTDPHIWLDPVSAQQEVENIFQGLKIVLSDEEQSQLKDNKDHYIEDLNRLNQAFESAFKEATERTFVTQHAAFGYLAHRYQLTQKSITGADGEQEPSPQQLATLENFIKEHQISVIYVESDHTDKLAATLAQATGAELDTLYTLESKPHNVSEEQADYLSLMYLNLEALKKSIH